MGALRRIANSVIDIIAPRVCEVCGVSLVGTERFICGHCLADLPRTVCHRDTFSEIHRRLMGHAPVDRAAAMFHYDGSSRYAGLIRNAKYRGRPEMMRHLAALFADELDAENFFDGIDIIEPVPMPCLRRWQRGYNQTEYLAQGLADVTGIAVGDHLRAAMHKAQAGRSGSQRLANVEGKYSVRHADELRGQHILVVDDVITTGSTLFTVTEAIHAVLAPDYRLSVLALSLTTAR